MYAVIKTGGKQYRVAAGDKIKVEQIAADVGQEVVFDQVLAVGNGAGLSVGTPLVSGASVSVTVVSHGRHDKVRIFKMRRRKHYQKHQGHRQNFTELLIGSILAPGWSSVPTDDAANSAHIADAANTATDVVANVIAGASIVTAADIIVDTSTVTEAIPSNSANEVDHGA